MASANTPETYVLMSGDSDAQKRWAGTVYAAGSGKPVQALQTNLAAVGCFEGKADGEFGPKTRTALRLFQWHLCNIRYRLTAGGQAVPHPGIFPAATSVFDATTRTALADFISGQYRCAGPLVRVGFSRFARFRVGVGSGVYAFQQLIPGTSSMVVDKEFARTLSAMNAKAGEEGLYIYVNQVFRVHGAPVGGPVVPPAKQSAHLIGRAIDMQLGSPGAKPASEMKSAAKNSPMGRFRDHVISLGCRYGGFMFNDAPHYDRQLSGEEWTNRFYFAQRQLDRGAGTRATRLPVL